MTLCFFVPAGDLEADGDGASIDAFRKVTFYYLLKPRVNLPAGAAPRERRGIIIDALGEVK